MQSRTPCILFAEDDDNDVLLMKRAMDRAGVRLGIAAVEDSQKAIEFIATNEEGSKGPCSDIMLLLLDLKLLGSTGYEVLEFLKEQPRFKRFPVVVLSSSCSVDGRARAVDLGADDFIIKPNGFDELTEVCRKLHRLIKASQGSIGGYEQGKSCTRDTQAFPEESRGC